MPSPNSSVIEAPSMIPKAANSKAETSETANSNAENPKAETSESMTDPLNEPDASPPAAGRPTPRPGRARITAAVIGAVLLGLIALLAFGSDDRLTPSNDVLGRRVPAISGESLDGRSYNIDNARGSRWVVVNFFATWCPGCVNEHPELVAFNQWANANGQAELVAVVFNDPAELVEAFFVENGGDWPVLDDPGIAINFQVAQIPETFVVAPSGQVVRHIQGEVRAADLVDLIEGS